MFQVRTCVTSEIRDLPDEQKNMSSDGNISGGIQKTLIFALMSVGNGEDVT